MGDGNATKGDLYELARRFGAPLADLDARTQSLALCFDVLVTVLGVEEKVKAELERRQNGAKEASLYKKRREAGDTEAEAETAVVVHRGKRPCAHPDHFDSWFCPYLAVAEQTPLISVP